MTFQDIPTKIKRVQLVDRLGSERNVPGTIHLTTSHFIFKADEGAKEIWIPNLLIGSAERGPISAAGSPIFLKCKHFQTLSLLIANDKECQDLFECLNRNSKLVNISDAFAFSRREPNGKKAIDARGNVDWSRLDWDCEYERQGANEMWKRSDFNADFKYCDTYPEPLWVPTAASTQVLIGSCRFRSRARLPALTFFYKPNGATICRCAQPLSGFSARCVEDESLMELIRQTTPTSTNLFIIDTRPRVNAMVNKVQGKGFEDARNYTNIQFHFFDIENIHVMRNSQNKLLEACQKNLSMTEYLKTVESSGWLRHVRNILECGKFIAESLLRGISCVILVEKDWLGFGHKFDDRCAHVACPAEENSPIFSQFLDVVYQLTRQKPRAFEFNERFLMDLHEHAYACVTGTFLGNCDKDRKDLRMATRTPSLWTQMDTHIDDYKNPFYKKVDYYLTDLDLRPQGFSVWTNLYNRFDTGIQPREYLVDIALDTAEHVQQLAFEQNSLSLEFQSKYSVAVHQQRLLNAEECSSSTCQREFVSRFERRLHCTVCGKIFCSRCIRTDGSVHKVCVQCA
ncbi:Myotubularin-related family protein [Aphelenchoides avenae]|nr:Myotubularin-related family protein [Aphelenchus avenae]